eukprot:m.96874 g.96874  ORF g.96874 m.96874 type:complete len:223 (+) comp13957_c0_seq5:515-1183(+)
MYCAVGPSSRFGSSGRLLSRLTNLSCSISFWAAVSSVVFASTLATSASMRPCKRFVSSQCARSLSCSFEVTSTGTGSSFCFSARRFRMSTMSDCARLSISASRAAWDFSFSSWDSISPRRISSALIAASRARTVWMSDLSCKNKQSTHRGFLVSTKSSSSKVSLQLLNLRCQGGCCRYQSVIHDRARVVDLTCVLTLPGCSQPRQLHITCRNGALGVCESLA